MKILKLGIFFCGIASQVLGPKPFYSVVPASPITSDPQKNIDGDNQGISGGYQGSVGTASHHAFLGTFGSTSGGVHAHATHTDYQHDGYDNQDSASPCERYKGEYRDDSSHPNEDSVQKRLELAQKAEDLTAQFCQEIIEYGLKILQILMSPM